MELFAIVRDRGGQRDWLSTHRDGWTDDLGDYVDFFDDREEAERVANDWNDYSAVKGFGYRYFIQPYEIAELEALGINP